jgi:putative membrane protein
MIATGLAVTALVYSAGAIRFWRGAGLGRSLPIWRAASFAAGLLTIGIALLSPLDSLAESLFSAHMVQHLLLMLVAPALLVLGGPSWVMLWALPARSRRSAAIWWNQRGMLQQLITTVSLPAVAWALSILALLIWHIPACYQAALRSESVHAAEHLSFLITGFLFWWVVLRPDSRRRLSEAASVLYVFTAALPGGLLGALLTFGGKPLYASQSGAAPLWGLTALEDQQLAGLIMWMPGGLIYLGAAAAFFLVWLRQEEIGGYRRGVVTAALGALLVLGLGGCKPKARPLGSDSTQTPGQPSAAIESLPAGRPAPGSGFTKVRAIVGLFGPESVRYDPRQDLYFVSNFTGTLTASDNNGFISRVRFDGRIDSLKFIAGGRGGVELNAPTGMDLAGDTLWVADVTKVRAFDSRSGKLLQVVDLGRFQPRLLNDVVVGPDHAVYITDTGIKFAGNGGLQHPGPDRIFRVGPDGRARVAAGPGHIEGPNGIAWDSAGRRFLVVSFTGKSIYQWSADRNAARVVGSGPGKWDGIEVLGDGRTLITSWADSTLYLLTGTQLTPAVLDLPEPADIGVDTRRHRVAIPVSSENRVELWNIPAAAAAAQ